MQTSRQQRQCVRRRWSPLLSVLVTLLALAGARSVESQQRRDPWLSVRFLEGSWTGKSDGEPGKGTVDRSYVFVLKNRYLHERNVSTYPPQGANKDGEIHEHWSFISYDRTRDALILRQFHQEGFVNQFVLVASSSSDKRLVFESESFENFPGWRGRETYELISNDEFVETFELGEVGKPLKVYSRNRFTRSKR
jgi:hypothetical protein